MKTILSSQSTYLSFSRGKRHILSFLIHTGKEAEITAVEEGRHNVRNTDYTSRGTCTWLVLCFME